MSTKRWLCPRCGGRVLAPARPRKDDIRRYCLACSQRTGRLVERVCPSREVARERRTAVRARRQAKAKQAESQRYTVDGLDVRSELTRLCALPFVRSLLPAGRRSIAPTISWSTRKRYTTGHARLSERSVHLGLYDGCPRHEAQALIAHELAHVILPSGVAHRERWRRTFARILADGYGLTDLPSLAMRGTIVDLQARVEQELRTVAGSNQITVREARVRRRRS